MIDGETYDGVIIEVVDAYGNTRKRVKCASHPSLIIKDTKFLNLFEKDDVVSFVARKERNRNDPTNDFWYATNIAHKEDK